MPDDIYPLGLGGGLTTDAINFALNNIYQYGQRMKQSNQQLGQGMSNIAAGGTADLSPMIRDAVSTSPLYTGTINWSGMTPYARAAMEGFKAKFPQLAGAMEKAPQMLSAEVGTKGLASNAAAQLGRLLPDAHMLTVRPSYAENALTLGHEVQHSLNTPRLAATNPLDALTIGKLLQEQLPSGYRGSLDTAINSQIAKPGLLQRFTNPNAPLQLTNPSGKLMRAAMDEGLAYLGENAARYPGNAQLQTLADRLGVNWRTNPIIPQGNIANVAPTAPAEFRNIGLDRLGTGMNPAEWLDRLRSQPGFDRFRQLFQKTQIAPKMGNEFDVFRGMAESDPLMQSYLSKGKLPEATAMTPDPHLAREFGMQNLDEGTSYIVGGKASPESIWSMVPHRAGTGKEITELLVNPQTLKDFKVLDKYELGKTGVEGMAPYGGRRYMTDINRGNLYQHLGVSKADLEKIKAAIPFHSDELYSPAMRGQGVNLKNRYVNSPLMQVIRQKLGMVPHPYQLFDTSDQLLKIDPELLKGK